MPPENEFKYTLTVLDGFTRYAWVIPLKHKDGLSVSNAFKEIIKNRIGHPINCELIKEKSFIMNRCINCLNLRKKIY